MPNRDARLVIEYFLICFQDLLYYNRLCCHGLTLVELIIVIVVIGILVAFTIVAFNVVVDRANNVLRMAEMRQWKQLFLSYKVVNETYPALSTGYGNYCLGTGFPTQNHVNQGEDASNQVSTNNPIGYCRDLLYNSSRHEASAELNNTLSSVGGIPGPENHQKLVIFNASVGPYYRYQSSGNYITGIFSGPTCPAGTFGLVFSCQNKKLRYLIYNSYGV